MEGLEGFLDRNEEVAPPHFFRQSHSGKLFEQGARRIGDLQFDAVFRELPIEFRESLRGRPEVSDVELAGSKLHVFLKNPN